MEGIKKDTSPNVEVKDGICVRADEMFTVEVRVILS
jgi:hypothetical protein